MKTKKVKAIPEEEMALIFGGYNDGSDDSIDCTSELASGGTTTDTYEEKTRDSVDCTSELASGGTTTDTYE